MKRWLFNLAAGVSLLLGVVTTAAWVWSYWTPSYVAYSEQFFFGRYDDDREWTGWYLAPYRGQIFYEQESIVYTAAPTSQPSNRFVAEDTVGLRTGALRILKWETNFGFLFVNEFTPGPAGTLYIFRVSSPFWAVVVATQLLPFMWLWRNHRNRTCMRAALCTVCGYDLRGTPDRCPECGAVAGKAQP